MSEIQVGAWVRYGGESGHDPLCAIGDEGEVRYVSAGGDSTVHFASLGYAQIIETERLTVVARPARTDPPATTDERLVELSGRVLVALAGLPVADRELAADEAARWAVAEARALLRECGA